MKKFKKIYIEITNMCNLNCPFCPNDNLIKKEMSLDDFEHILKSIDKYTDYIYLHVKGEPLLHSKFKEILELCEKYNKKVNITTNATLLKKRVSDIIDSKVVRQVNISLQSLVNDNYLNNIMESVKELINNNIYVVYRFWALDSEFNEFQQNIISQIVNYYNLNKEIEDKIYKEKNIKLLEKLYLNKDIEFIWPSLDCEYISDTGTCYGLRTQMGILVDGSVIPCCLDSKGVINLGNIFETNFDDIMNSDRVNKIVSGFQNNKIYEELCQKCDYRTRF